MYDTLKLYATLLRAKFTEEQAQAIIGILRDRSLYPRVFRQGTLKASLQAAGFTDCQAEQLLSAINESDDVRTNRRMVTVAIVGVTIFLTFMVTFFTFAALHR